MSQHISGLAYYGASFPHELTVNTIGPFESYEYGDCNMGRPHNMRTTEAVSALPRSSKLPRRGRHEALREQGLDAGVGVTGRSRLAL